ncbi:MOSC domain-containing protein [Sphingomonas canadensis]|uniref:MOSC domain-containing protein n=1 Tax=Sphingomonas canadensis TaxID=1219257 RepID=A0ABW3H6G7_9SPHN|nr:MOSC domain-containing protein [Sphingomonas canadensis]MCW3836791.1 MOSC domain-containing protein [Sphingomonas canadensis]
MTGRIAGIARHAESRGPIELLDRVRVTPEGGVEGDRNGGKNKRQVSLIEAGDWAAATAEAGADLPWWQRRANLLVEDFDLPHGGGVRVRIGADVVIELRTEIDPCARMDALAPGLRVALEPDWRGGAGGKVIAGGEIAVGDAIRIEQ